MFEYKPGSKFPITPLDRPMEWEIVTSEGMKFKALQLFILVSRKVKPFIPSPAVLRLFDSLCSSSIPVLRWLPCSGGYTAHWFLEVLS